MIEGLNILVLEDSHTQARIIGRMLEGLKCTARAVNSARDFNTLPELFDEKFDVALIDIHFNEANGLDLIDAIKRRWPGVICVAMTTNSQDDYGGLAEARERGAELVLRKPFKAPEALAMLEDVDTLRATGERRKHIVIIDDSSTACKIAEGMLAGKGFRVTSFLHTEEAMQRLNYDHVDVVVTDLIMPGMSGHQMIKLVRDVWPDVGIVAMSGGVISNSDGGKSELEKALNLGVCALLPKPYGPDDLMRVIRRALANKAATDADDEADMVYLD